MNDNLNATALKAVLWETLNKLKSNKMDAAIAHGIANQAREILRTTKVQLAIFGYANKPITNELLEFAKGESNTYEI